MKNGVCPKCASRRIKEGIRVVEMEHLGQLSPLSLEKIGPWNTKKLTAYVCGDCGFTGLYTLRVEGLYDAWMKAKK